MKIEKADFSIFKISLLYANADVDVNVDVEAEAGAGMGAEANIAWVKMWKQARTRS